MQTKITTKNGIKIYGYKNPSLHGFFISLVCRAGIMYESAEDNGITHFFEHIAIRNINKVMGGKLYSDLDRRGVDFNATTYPELVQFYMSGASDKLPYAAEVITKIFSPIILTSEEIESERKRIKAEIREADEKSSLSAFSNAIVHADTSLGRSITGTISGVSKITKARLENYRRNTLTASTVFFYLTGNYSDADVSYLASLVEALDIPIGTGGRDNIAPLSANHFKRDCEVAVKGGDDTIVRFSFDIDMKRAGVPETDVIYDMLLSGYNSRFFIEMSEVRGLFYDLSGALEHYRNLGQLYFTYELRAKDLEAALEITVDILNDFKKTLHAPEDLMKNYYVDNAYLLYDDAREFNFTMFCDNLLMKLGYASFEDRIEAYRRVTPEDVRRVACEIFTPENLVLTIKGDKKKIDTEKIRKILLRLK